jgi:hypothetical protein
MTTGSGASMGCSPTFQVQYRSMTPICLAKRRTLQWVACFRGHREFIAFLLSFSQTPPSGELHLICDNFGTQKHPKVKAWLQRRFALLPTFQSDQRLLAQPGLTLARHYQPAGDSARQFHRASSNWDAPFLAQWNQDAKPLVSTKTAAQIKRSIRNAKTYFCYVTLAIHNTVCKGPL